MKKLFVSLLSLLLVSCASQYRFNPLQNTGIGPFHTYVGQNLYRVHFKSLDSNKETTRLQALTHAKYLTLQQNLDWFIVLKEQVITEQLINPETDQLSRITCAQSGCDQTTYHNPQFKHQFDPTAPPTTTEIILMIRMGRGIQPADKDSYSAY